MQLVVGHFADFELVCALLGLIVRFRLRRIFGNRLLSLVDDALGQFA